jgi:hypothetical protein
MDFSTKVQLSLIGMAGTFALYSVVHVQNMTPLQAFGSSIDVEDEGGEGRAMFFQLYSIMQSF